MSCAGTITRAYALTQDTCSELASSISLSTRPVVLHLDMQHHYTPHSSLEPLQCNVSIAPCACRQPAVQVLFCCRAMLLSQMYSCAGLKRSCSAYPNTCSMSQPALFQLQYIGACTALTENSKHTLQLQHSAVPHMSIDTCKMEQQWLLSCFS